VVTFTSKDEHAETDNISIELNLGLGEELPEGITSATIVAMSGGAGVMDMDSALDALGTGDDANEKFFTELVHGNGDATAGLNSISTYNGQSNDFVGCWAKTVHRPFRSLTGDIVAGSGGLTAAKALGDGRKLDRTGLSQPSERNRRSGAGYHGQGQPESGRRALRRKGAPGDYPWCDGRPLDERL
jgi:hypothetical protein